MDGSSRDVQQALVAPHVIEAEQAVLGALLLNNAFYERVSEIVSADKFYDGVHAAIYTEIERLILANTAATPITLKGVFGDKPILPELTYWQYLGRLIAEAPDPRHAMDYARTVDEMATRRALVIIGDELIRGACDIGGGTTPKQNIEEAEKALFDLAERRNRSHEIMFGDALRGAVTSVSRAYEAGGALVGQPTGISDIDDKLGGLQSSNLIVIGGRPAMGKTALVTNIAFNVASGVTTRTGDVVGGHVHFFSQEMSAEELAMRVLAEQSGISSEKLRRGMVSQDEFNRIYKCSASLSGLNITVDETGGITLPQLAQRARRVKRQHGTKLLIVDYLQLMQATGKRENRTQDITQITIGLKALAKELSVPVIALSQLSRAVEGRADKRPQLADLRESGSIEQDSDVIMFVYRDEYYLNREEPDFSDSEKYADWQRKIADSTGKAEIIVAKFRHGTTGTIKLGFNAALTRFDSLNAGGAS